MRGPDGAGWPQPRTIAWPRRSEAFFPFPDGLLAVAEAGATAVIQPGGSVNDQKGDRHRGG